MNFDEIIVRSVGRKPETEAFKIARVIQVQPLQVLIENEDESVELPEVPSLSEPLSVGDYLYLHIRQNRTVVLGKIKPVTPPPVPEYTPKVDIALQSPWVLYTPTSTWGGFKALRQGDLVSLEGMVTGGTAGASKELIGLLPPSHRPPRHRIVTVAVNDQPVSAQITPAGDIHLRGTFNSGWISFNGVTFNI